MFTKEQGTYIAESLRLCSELNEKDLYAVILDALTLYGTNGFQLVDDIIFPSFEITLQRLPVAARRELFRTLTERIEDLKTSSRSIFPFVFLESDASVVSSATLWYISTSDIPAGDPTQEARSLLVHLRHAQNKGAVVAGILALGDRRFLPALVSSTELLSTQDLEFAALNPSAIPTLASFEFWLKQAEICAEGLKSSADGPAVSRDVV